MAKAARKTEKLGEYERKRDFGKTSEPAATRARRKRAEKAPLRFVVQEHSARRLHWDLRLEHDGVAASWAIPNGIPTDPEENRKAVQTEDHPLEYLEFEGEIPAGEYGAGTMTDLGPRQLRAAQVGAGESRPRLRRRAVAGSLRAVPCRQDGEGLDDPPDRPAAGAARPLPGGVGADAGQALEAAGRRQRLGGRGEVGRGAGDRLLPPRPDRAADPQPQRRHRPVPGGAAALAPDRRPRRRPRRRAGRLRRGGQAELRPPAAAASTRPPRAWCGGG